MLELLAALALSAASARASVDLSPGLRAPQDQGQTRNTCSAFSSTALAEYLFWQQTGQKRDLSEQYTYYLGRTRALDTPYLRQMYLGSDGLAGFLAVKGLSYGMADETEWKYSPQNGVASGLAGCTGASPAPFCFTGKPPAVLEPLAYKLEPEFVERDRIAEFLETERRPVVMNLQWYFGAADAHGDLRMPTAAEVTLCREQGQGCGGHVVLLTGHDSTTGRYWFRNSWGTSWGSGGYGTLPDAYVENHCEICANLPYLDQYTGEERQFVLDASRGATARLVEGP